MQFLRKSIIWILFIPIVIGLLAFFIHLEPQTWGGDIVEYYGTSESLLNHASPNLTLTDENKLEETLNHEYFEMKGYYIQGRDGNRYPVHFIFYSILLIPIRLLLRLFNQPEIKTIVFTNVAILTATAFFFLKRANLNLFQKTVLLITLFLSPFVYFIAWPGPDILYMCAMLFSIYFFIEKKYLAAALAATIASWHSQPLFIYAFGMLGFYIAHIVHIHYEKSTKQLSLHLQNIQLKHIFKVLLVLGLLFIPYLYNVLAFGVLSPWQILQDFWTEYYGFGIQNASLKKLFEQLFDLNMGLFWYIPVLFLAGGYSLIKKSRNSVTNICLVLLIILTAFGYQTNPAWHYGTAGYGPTRHAVFILPILLMFFIMSLKVSRKYIIIILLFVITQAWILAFNGGLRPNLLSVLNHSPYATYILNNYPSLYNPTPEIFVDRTNHTDLDYPTSAFYKNNGLCTKAYVLLHEKSKAIEECGYIPSKYLSAFEQSEDLQNIEKNRTLKTTHALFLPRAYGCDKTFKPEYGQEYVCMRTVQDVITDTGIIDVGRVRPISGLEGGWELGWGRPQKITVPAGYGIEYYSFEGIYIDY